MSTPFVVPFLIGQPQKLSIVLSATRFNLRVYWNDPNQCWNLDISDASNNAILQGIPLITGANLLSQYAYLGIPGKLIVQTTNNADAVPTFTNLGNTGNLYYLI